MTRQCKYCLHRIECFDKYYKWWWQRCKWYERKGSGKMCDDERTTLNPKAMSAEEAIELFKGNIKIANEYPRSNVFSWNLEQLKNASAVAISALGKQTKYAWHDLLKDPNDLPKTDERVVVKVEWYEDGQPCDSDYCTDYYHHNRWVYDNETINSTVVAWKYIEPFEEEKE